MLLKEYEQWAVPVLPEKTIFERASTHKSNFIQERMRKMKHFLTLVRSHRKLKRSQYFKEFLCESDQVFKATIKNLQQLEEHHNAPIVKRSKSWFSAASNSFSSAISRASDFGRNIVPTIKHLLTNQEDGYDVNDILINKYSEKLEMLHRSFIDLYKLATTIRDKRKDDCKIERGLGHSMNCLASTNDEELTKILSLNANILNEKGEKASNNLGELKELLYATESHLVWIESVQDLIIRKEQLCDELISVKQSIKDAPLNHHSKEISTKLLTLTDRRERMIKGIKIEMKKLSAGTLDFYPRYVQDKFIESQLGYYQECISRYQD